MRTRARLAMVAALAATVALLSPAAAQAADDFGPTLPGLPAEVSNGGVGTPSANAAVSAACAAGGALTGVEWFTLPAGDLGQVLVRAKREIVTTGHRPEIYSTVHVALLDSVTGSVLQCSGDPVAVTSAQSVRVAVWFDAAEWQSWVDSCAGGGFGCPGEQSTTVYADHSAPVPDNDAPANARSIAALPFSDSGNTVRATDDYTDGPSSCATLGVVMPLSHGSVWWKWTAPADGVIDVAGGGGVTPCTGAYDITDGGLTPVTPVTVDLVPTTRDAVQAGHTYLLGFFFTEDGYYHSQTLRTGGPYALHVDWVTRGPGAVSSLRTSSSGIDDLLVAWGAPSDVPHGAAVTGYHVQIVKHGSGDAPTVITLNDPAATSYTFTGVDTSATYDITLHALSDAGDGVSRTRVFSLADSGVYGNLAGPPARPSAVRGANSVTVGWSAPAYAGTTDLTGYRVRVFVGSTTTVARTVVVGDVASVKVTGLRNGVAYTADVAAINAAGAGTSSSRSRAVVPATRPGAPVIGTAYAGVRGLPVTAVATWSRPKSDGGSPITAYLVTLWRYDAAGHLLGSTARRTTATHLKVTMLLPSGRYRFSINAVNAIGAGVRSARSNLVVAR